MSAAVDGDYGQVNAIVEKPDSFRDVNRRQRQMPPIAMLPMHVKHMFHSVNFGIAPNAPHSIPTKASISSFTFDSFEQSTGPSKMLS